MLLCVKTWKCVCVCVYLYPNGILFRIEGRPHEGGRRHVLTTPGDTYCGYGRQNKAIRLREMQQQIIEDNTLCEGIKRVSLSTTDRFLQRNKTRMKQVYRDHLSETVREWKSNDVNVNFYNKLNTRMYNVLSGMQHMQTS